MDLQPKSLMELMNKALSRIDSSYKSVDKFITDGKESQNFIDKLMKKNTLHFPGKAQPGLSTSSLSKVYRYPQERARHIAISFLFGMVLSEFGGFYESLPEVLNRETENEQMKAALAQRMWLITSLSHDTGYALPELSDEKLDIEGTYKKRFLLTDTYTDPQMGSINNFFRNYSHVFAHNYEQILNYNRYIRTHKTWDPPHEKNDHGILGGLDMFDHLTRNMQNMNDHDRAQELALIKACCLTVAQHNIFKSPDANYDEYYKEFYLDRLFSTSDFRITRETPLLLFLCLVDTIECMKRFSRGATKGPYLKATTILEKIYLYVDKDQIVLDFNDLWDHIKERDEEVTDEKLKLEPIYKKHLNALKSFHTWTVFKGQADPNNEDRITITLEQ